MCARTRPIALLLFATFALATEARALDRNRAQLPIAARILSLRAHNVTHESGLQNSHPFAPRLSSIHELRAQLGDTDDIENASAIARLTREEDANWKAIDRIAPAFRSAFFTAWATAIRHLDRYDHLYAYDDARKLFNELKYVLKTNPALGRGERRFLCDEFRNYLLALQRDFESDFDARSPVYFAELKKRIQDQRTHDPWLLKMGDWARRDWQTSAYAWNEQTLGELEILRENVSRSDFPSVKRPDYRLSLLRLKRLKGPATLAPHGLFADVSEHVMLYGGDIGTVFPRWEGPANAGGPNLDRYRARQEVYAEHPWGKPFQRDDFERMMEGEVQIEQSGSGRNARFVITGRDHNMVDYVLYVYAKTGGALPQHAVHIDRHADTPTSPFEQASGWWPILRRDLLGPNHAPVLVYSPTRRQRSAGERERERITYVTAVPDDMPPEERAESLAFFTRRFADEWTPRAREIPRELLDWTRARSRVISHPPDWVSIDLDALLPEGQNAAMAPMLRDPLFHQMVREARVLVLTLSPEYLAGGDRPKRQINGDLEQAFRMVEAIRTGRFAELVLESSSNEHAKER